MIALTPNMIHMLASLPLTRPYVDLAWWQFAILSLPYVNLAFAFVIVLMTSLRLRSESDGRTICLYYLIVSMAVLAFNLAIIL
jgi:hypothetical protein